MTSLREEAEKAAIEILGLMYNNWTDDGSNRTEGAIAADAIERVAKAFAERVADETQKQIDAGSPMSFREMMTRAIAAAERGED